MQCWYNRAAIFGINLRYIKPFIGAAFRWSSRRIYASIVGLGATGTGVTGIFGILLHLHSPINYIIMFAIALGVAFFTTLLLGWMNLNNFTIRWQIILSPYYIYKISL